MRAGSPSKWTVDAGLVEPADEPGVVGEERLDGFVGLADVLRVARERHPAERSATFGELRPDVRRHESGELERPVEPAELRLGADRVAVVEDLGSGILESDHRGDLLGHAAAGAVGEARGVALGLGAPVVDVDADRQVGERVVGAGLIGDDVDRRAAQQQLRKDQRGVAHDADAECAALVLGRDDPVHGLVEVGRVLVEIPVLDAAGQARLVDVDDEHRAAVEGHGQGLRAAHAAASARQRESSGEVFRPECPIPASRSPSSRDRAIGPPRRTSRTCPAGCPGCRCRSTSRLSSGRTS